jgi:O-antigen/teichoic acid export membrane protein
MPLINALKVGVTGEELAIARHQWSWAEEKWVQYVRNIVGTWLAPIMALASVNYVLLGAQRIKEFNYVQIAQSVLFLGFITLALLGLRAGVTGAILAGLFTWVIVDAIVFRPALRVAGGIDLKPNTFYMKRAATYGIQAHISNILGFLNYRVDMFLVNWFLGPAAVGLYSVGVGIVEKL